MQDRLSVSSLVKYNNTEHSLRYVDYSMRRFAANTTTNNFNNFNNNALARSLLLTYR